MVLEADKTGLFLGVVVVEVVPKHASLVLYNTNIGSNVAGIIFDERAPGITPGLLEHSSKLKKPSEPPVTLFLGEAMMGGMMGKKRRVIDVPHDQAKLYAATPVFWYAVDVLKSMFKVYRRLVDIITEGKQKNAPVQISPSQ